MDRSGSGFVRIITDPCSGRPQKAIRRFRNISLRAGACPPSRRTGRTSSPSWGRAWSWTLPTCGGWPTAMTWWAWSSTAARPMRGTTTHSSRWTGGFFNQNYQLLVVPRGCVTCVSSAIFVSSLLCWRVEKWTRSLCESDLDLIIFKLSLWIISVRENRFW